MIYKTPSWKLKVEQHKHNKTPIIYKTLHKQFKILEHEIHKNNDLQNTKLEIKGWATRTQQNTNYLQNSTQKIKDLGIWNPQKQWSTKHKAGN